VVRATSPKLTPAFPFGDEMERAVAAAFPFEISLASLAPDRRQFFSRLRLGTSDWCALNVLSITVLNSRLPR
jgi:hypothetical protein